MLSLLDDNLIHPDLVTRAIGKLKKSLSECGGWKSHVSAEACSPFCGSCPSFSPPDPSSDPFVGEKLSRSLEAANYRVLTARWLSPKCLRHSTSWKTHTCSTSLQLQLTRYSLGLCVQKQAKQRLTAALKTNVFIAKTSTQTEFGEFGGWCWKRRSTFFPN